MQLAAELLRVDAQPGTVTETDQQHPSLELAGERIDQGRLVGGQAGDDLQVFLPSRADALWRSREDDPVRGSRAKVAG